MVRDAVSRRHFQAPSSIALSSRYSRVNALSRSFAGRGNRVVPLSLSCGSRCGYRSSDPLASSVCLRKDRVGFRCAGFYLPAAFETTPMRPAACELDTSRWTRIAVGVTSLP